MREGCLRRSAPIDIGGRARPSGLAAGALLRRGCKAPILLHPALKQPAQATNTSRRGFLALSAGSSAALLASSCQTGAQSRAGYDELFAYLKDEGELAGDTALVPISTEEYAARRVRLGELLSKLGDLDQTQRVRTVG